MHSIVGFLLWNCRYLTARTTDWFPGKCYTRTLGSTLRFAADKYNPASRDSRTLCLNSTLLESVQHGSACSFFSPFGPNDAHCFTPPFAGSGPCSGTEEAQVSFCLALKSSCASSVHHDVGPAGWQLHVQAPFVELMLIPDLLY